MSLGSGSKRARRDPGDVKGVWRRYPRTARGTFPDRRAPRATSVPRCPSRPANETSPELHSSLATQRRPGGVRVKREVRAPRVHPRPRTSRSSRVGSSVAPNRRTVSTPAWTTILPPALGMRPDLSPPEDFSHPGWAQPLGTHLLAPQPMGSLLLAEPPRSVNRLMPTID